MMLHNPIGIELARTRLELARESRHLVMSARAAVVSAHSARAETAVLVSAMHGVCVTAAATCAASRTSRQSRLAAARRPTSLDADAISSRRDRTVRTVPLREGDDR